MNKYGASALGEVPLFLAAPFVPSANWLQGRTVFGGLFAVLSLQAALCDRSIDLPPLSRRWLFLTGSFR